MSSVHRTALGSVFAVLALACSALGGTVPLGGRVIYRLDPAATYEEGCYGPCACAIRIIDDTTGTMILRLASDDGTTQTYDVTNVNWYVNTSTTVMHAVGSGTYTRTDTPSGWMQQMDLRIRVDGGPVNHYVSDLVPGGSDMSIITAIAPEYDHDACYRSLFHVEASVVPADEIICETLGDSSNYSEGCYPPCACPILTNQPLNGSFSLVPLDLAGTVERYAVVDADFRVLTGTAPSSSFVGDGQYTRISGFAGWDQQLQMSLSVDGAAPTAFDSGLVSGGGDFPLIDAAVSINGMYCYDTVLDIRAGAGPCACVCEWTGDVPGHVDVFDLLMYLQDWFARSPAADIDGVAGVDVNDLLAYLRCWFVASGGGTCG